LRCRAQGPPDCCLRWGEHALLPVGRVAAQRALQRAWGAQAPMHPAAAA
jgi:hypothetical protein